MLRSFLVKLKVGILESQTRTVEVTIERFITESGREGVLVIVDGENQIRPTVALHKPTDPDNLRVAIARALKRLPYPDWTSAEDKAIWKELRVWSAVSGEPLHKDLKELEVDFSDVPPLIEGLDAFRKAVLELGTNIRKVLGLPVVEETQKEPPKEM